MTEFELDPESVSRAEALSSRLMADFRTVSKQVPSQIASANCSLSNDILSRQKASQSTTW